LHLAGLAGIKFHHQLARFRHRLGGDQIQREKVCAADVNSAEQIPCMPVLADLIEQPARGCDLHLPQGVFCVGSDGCRRIWGRYRLGPGSLPTSQDNDQQQTHELIGHGTLSSQAWRSNK
jgi:hypothetical protein